MTHGEEEQNKILPPRAVWAGVWLAQHLRLDSQTDARRPPPRPLAVLWTTRVSLAVTPAVVARALAERHCLKGNKDSSSNKRWVHCPPHTHQEMIVEALDAYLDKITE